ncbi:ornithine cyclodeaminase family protein [Nitratireductor aquimarinus]|uniref:ornithine cyclodeaminase family protein n=1 Tax=Nitratireductor TaxID=245876 RepID=UPI0019D3C8D3|nr:MULTISPECIES: ornithine cyclodeaminase family protein [Nitratireductor]MBN7776627.1 ornithine cyclodeaminase family protein [Nitratireductor pacificus]MBN7779494.1 ornithine cyclodeaminase family protein [Nitratireductor pacificus]MBN7788301.1 ornithine cyclodeaminase family protein [Nitratireductor aquimarinus]MBY6098348.1 ornithine cyclodeaminase family protein [Nitratireductor aquimarinus]MCA1261032.1 ornithine cyclodeaminase family protein [Nitratireductor aquimarinus]
MKVYSAEEIRARITPSQMVEALREGFRQDIISPLRHNDEVADTQQGPHNLLTMPSWIVGGYGCVKLVNIVPGNRSRNLPSVMSSVLLFSAETGQHFALLDGEEVTAFRTACASALAADYLARPGADSLLVVGAGAVGSRLPSAYAAVRDLRRIGLWNRNPGSSKRLATTLSDQGYTVEVFTDLEEAVGRHDIISCATLSEEPLVRGAWMRNGQHLDLIGSFVPTMREADHEAVRRAEVYVDSPAAIVESGDIAAPISAGFLSRDAIRGDLSDLCRGHLPGRTSASGITLFKSVGIGSEDLAAAMLIHRQMAG